MVSSPVLMTLLGVVLVVAVIAVAVIMVAAKRRPHLNVTRYQTQWLAIENSVSRGNEASWQVAIMNADKLVDQALRESHYKGSTMGERMKVAQSVWKNANHVWGAHKVRNQLAHEVNTQLSYDVTLRSLSAFKQALKDLGAI